MGPVNDIDPVTISLCMGSSCFARGNRQVLQKIEQFIDRHQLSEQVQLKGHLCNNECGKGPHLIIGQQHYEGVKPEQIDSICREHLGDLIQDQG